MLHKKQFRNFAVSDFGRFQNCAKSNVRNDTEYKKTWALYLKWGQLCKFNPGKYSSANGKTFTGSPESRTFQYSCPDDADTLTTEELVERKFAAYPEDQRPQDRATWDQWEKYFRDEIDAARVTPAGLGVAPVLYAYKRTPDHGQIQVTLGGVGQCEWFAMHAYADLAAGGIEGKTPMIQKISTPSHNWVLVNGDHPDQNKWYAVDYWMLALGTHVSKCICPYPNSPFAGEPIEIIKTKAAC
ncbi:MAG: hypothetical protein MK102_06100 [Fuerstiella sp.]|nr:hypothetical protein [Fuerstiella sp.]